MPTRRALVAALACAALFAARLARAVEVLKIGTLATEASPWGQVLRVWADSVHKKTGGAVEIQLFFNGIQGDEAGMIGKIKAGQLDGAVVTAVGLGKIYRPILALQMPGLLTTWGKMDAARDAMKGAFEKGAKDAGFAILGWDDVGAVHLLSKGFQVRTPDDLRGKKPWMWRDDDSQPVYYQVIGGVTAVPLNVPEVLPALDTGAVDVVQAPALVVEELQWGGKLDTVNADVGYLSIGALVVSSKRLDSLGENQRNILLETGRIAANALTKRIRADDDAAFARLKAKLTVVTLSDEEKAKWRAIDAQTWARLKGHEFPAAIVDELESLAK